MRADRLLTIIMRLQTRGRQTAQVLAGELGVSRRTILRDVEALSLAGIPVYAEGGHGGGIALDEGRALAADPASGGLVRSAEKTRMIFAPLSLLTRWRGQWIEGQPVVPVLSGGLDFVPFQETRETGAEALQGPP